MAAHNTIERMVARELNEALERAAAEIEAWNPVAYGVAIPEESEEYWRGYNEAATFYESRMRAAASQIVREKKRPANTTKEG